MSPVITAVKYSEFATTETLAVTSCGECNIIFAIPAAMDRKLREDGQKGEFYCPQGHRLHYPGKSASQKKIEEQQAEIDRLTRQRNYATERADENSRRLREEKRSKAAYKGQLTKMRNRILAGVCPVPGCQRTGFKAVTQHIHRKHPEWAAIHSELMNKEHA